MLDGEAAVVRLVVIVIILRVCRIMLRLKCVIGIDRRGALQTTLEQGPFRDSYGLFLSVFFNGHKTAAVFKKMKVFS